jgi:hypothetical protein
MKNNSIMAFLGLALTLGAGASGAAEDAPDVWLWSARAPLLNRSTEALATGHPARAARLARAAHEAASQAPERVIALHNLCLALIAQGTPADIYCRTAIQGALVLAPVDDRVTRQRGSLVIGIPAEGESFSLARLVRNNIARAYGLQVVNDMAEEG